MRLRTNVHYAPGTVITSTYFMFDFYSKTLAELITCSLRGKYLSVSDCVLVCWHSESKLAFISSNSPLTEIFYVSHCTIIPKLTTDHTVNLKWPPASDRDGVMGEEEFSGRVMGCLGFNLDHNCSQAVQPLS